MASPDDRYRAEYAAYKRRLVVEKLVLDSLAQGKNVGSIQGYDGDIELRDSDWKRRQRERRGYSFPLSLVEPLDGDIFDQPKQVRLDRAKFTAWLRSIRGKGAAAETQDAAEEFREWLVSEVAKGKKTHNKPWYLAEGVRRFGVTPRQASIIWAPNVPAEWKAPGPEKGRKRS
jgi:hypothetical protein